MLVKKNGGTLHFCSDYRCCNEERYLPVTRHWRVSWCPQWVLPCNGRGRWVLAGSHRLSWYWKDCIQHPQRGCLSEMSSHSAWEMHRCNWTCIILKPKKCELFCDTVEYLGDQVNWDGIRHSEGKVNCLQTWKAPATVIQVRTFFEFMGYYGRLLAEYSQIALPLTRLTKKDVPFMWTMVCQQAFDTLRTSLMKIPMLHYVKQGKDFILDTNASHMP